MKNMKKPLKNYLRNIAVMLAIALVIGTISVSADVNDNLGTSIDKILGPVNASLNGSFSTSSTNGKLNQMKKDMDTTKSSVSDLLAPYLSSLTVWVDSTNAAYSGKTVSVTNSKGETKTAAFAFRNGHYEATFPKLVRNEYSLGYSFILNSGKALDLSTQVSLVAGTNQKQLFGDLQQMSIADIQACCKVGMITSIAKVGDTFSDGTYTYTIIGINQDKPSDANGNALSSSQYGDVLTVMCLGAPAGAGNGSAVTTDASKTPWGTNRAPMNSSDTNSGSWKSSAMRSSTMTSYLAKLPTNTQKAIGYVQKVTGQYGGANITTGDKCFLLSGKEIFGGTGNGNGSYCTTAEANATFQYQYFANIATSTASRAITGAPDNWWWLRSPYCNDSGGFCNVYTGSSTNGGYASYSIGVFAAFCIY